MKNRKKLISIIITCAMLLSCVPPWQAVVTATENARSYGIGNPRIENGVTTWDCVYFGSYPQSDATGAVKEPIKWRVLSVDGDDAFLLADKCLDAKPYNEEYEGVTWETCTLRKWLNGEFYNRTFNAQEKKAVRETVVVNDDNPYYDTEGGSNTTDKVYLLSIAEAYNVNYGFDAEYQQYSNTGEAENTDYAKANGACTSTAGNGHWWLRSPADDSYFLAHVYNGDYGNIVAYNVDNSNFAVRPALHINLSSSTWKTAGWLNSEHQSGGDTNPPDINPPDINPSDSSGITCIPDVTVAAGNQKLINARLYAETREDMKALCDGVSWSSSDASVAEVVDGGFLQSAEAAVYSGPQGEYSLWWAGGMVGVKGKKEGTAVVTGTLGNGMSVSCNVTVTGPEASGPSDTEGTGGSFDIGENQEGSADDGKGVARFFPASWSLKSARYPVQISQKQNTDGTYTIKASIGIGRSDLFDKDTEWNKYKKACETANKNSGDYDVLYSYRDLFGLKDSTVIHSTGWKGSKTPKLSVMGYVENKYDKYGNLISADGRIAGDLKWSGGISWQFATPVGPMYLKLEGEGKASLEGGPSWNDKNKKMTLNNGKLTVTPSISLTGGYGIDKVASLSATGKASVAVQAFPPSKGTFTAEASVNVYALFVIDYTWTLAKYTKQMWNTTGKSRFMAGNMRNAFVSESEPSFIDTDFADADTGWMGSSLKSRAGRQNMWVLQKGLLPSSLPMLASVGDKQVMVWQGYDEKRNITDGAVLMYSVCENDAWSEPKAVCDDGYGDACADMQLIDGKIRLVWQKHKVNMAADDAGDVLAGIGRYSEIYYAQFDDSGNTFTNVTQVTDNETCDMMPRFVRNTDDVRIAYVRNDADSIMQSEGINTVHVSEWNGAGFESEEKLLESPGTVERYEAYMDNGEVRAVYVAKANEIMAVLDSGNEITEELGGLMQMAEDGTVSRIDYADGMINLISNGTLYCYNPKTGEITSHMAGNSAFDAAAVYCGNGLKNGYIWSVYDGETDTGRIVASFASGTGYSEPVTIYETSGEISRHIAPVLTGDGTWNIALNQKVVGDGTHNLAYLCQEETKDMELIAAYVNEDDVRGNLTGVDFMFTNCGETAVDEVTVQITFENGDIVRKTVPVTAAPGETVAGTAYMDISNVKERRNIDIAVYETGQTPDADNVVSDVIEQTDVTVVATAYGNSDGIQITAYATNKGECDTNVNICLFGDAGMVNQIASHNGVSIAAGEKAEVKFAVNPDTVEYNENGTAYLAVCADVLDGDYNMSDNVAYIALYKGEKVEADTSPKETNSPDETERPSVTEKPDTTEKPSVTEKPYTTEKPSVTEKPYTTEKPNATEKPSITEMPDTTKKPDAAVTPVVTDTPNVNAPGTTDYAVLKDKTGAVYTIIRDDVSKPEVSYTAPKNKKITSVMIPDKVTVDGTSYTVTSVSAKAFQNCKKLKRVTIGKNVKLIGKKAFYGCTKLKNITIKTKKLTVKNVGGSAFSKIHKKAVVKTVKTKLKPYKKILKKRGVNGRKQKIISL